MRFLKRHYGELYAFCGRIGLELTLNWDNVDCKDCLKLKVKTPDDFSPPGNI